MGAAGLLGLASPREQRGAGASGTRDARHALPKIKDISVIECQPAGVRLTVVKITTDQDGLYGYGCATFTQRADLVKPAVERYLKPFLLGKTTDRIEDIWQILLRQLVLEERSGAEQRHQRRGSGAVGHQGPPGGDAGVPTGRRQMPRGRRLLRPRRRRRISKTWWRARRNTWRRASATCACRWACPAWRAMDPAARRRRRSKALHDKPRVRTRPCTLRRALKLFEVLPQGTGRRSRTAARHARARDARTRRCSSARTPRNSSLFFLEDPLSPEDIAYFRQIRQQCATPIAMGELFNSPHEWSR